MLNEIRPLNLGHWKLKVRTPSTPGPHPIMFLLHGWTGNEDVMWVFASKIPKHYLLIAPRAPYPTGNGGYSWVRKPSSGFSTLNDFLPAVDDLLALIAQHPGAPNQTFDQVSLMGFSQGAALAYSLTFLHPERVQFVAGLAGFVPQGTEALQRRKPLTGKPFFVAHGTEDEIVPISVAREGVKALERAGGQVTFCEAEVGHKVGVDCLRGIEKVISAHSPETENR